jgi:hypothetical protein
MPIRGESSVKLEDGTKLTLAVNFATLAKAAAQTGIIAQQILPVLGNNKDPRQMLVMLAMLQHSLHRHHRDLDEDDVGEMMLTDGDALSFALLEGVKGAFSDDEEESGDNAPPNPPKAKPRGTGTSSSRRGQKKV